RAEHIRLQCRYEDLPAGAPERRELWNRAWELEKQHRDSWFGALSALVDDVPNISRGFPDFIYATTEKFLLNAPEIFRLAPIREVMLYGALPHIEGLANCPFLTRVRALIFIGPDPEDDDDDSQPLNADGAPVLAGSPHLHNLRDLDLERQAIASGGLTALARAKVLAGMEYLRLEKNRITDKGLRSLAKAAHLTQLKRLELADNRIGA